MILCRFCNKRHDTLAKEQAHIFDKHYRALMNERKANSRKATHQREQKELRDMERGMDKANDEA